MPDNAKVPRLHVEGSDDLHTIKNLLKCHGIPLDEHYGPVIIEHQRGDEGVLREMLLNKASTAVHAASQSAIGFVLDADDSVATRWQSIRDRLTNVPGLDLPSSVPSDGYIGESALSRTRVGVWIMPDNVTEPGKLEHLLRTLIPRNDAIFSHAEDATKVALQLGAKFEEKDLVKAELHCWLAWQKKPGRPYGTALAATYFDSDSDAARSFVAWFQHLFAGVLDHVHPI